MALRDITVPIATGTRASRPRLRDIRLASSFICIGVQVIAPTSIVLFALPDS